MVIKATSFRDVSEIAMVPDRECRIPPLLRSAAQAEDIRPVTPRMLAAPSCLRTNLRFMRTPKRMWQSVRRIAGLVRMVECGGSSHLMSSVDPAPSLWLTQNPCQLFLGFLML